MSNCEVTGLPLLEVPLQHTKDALRCVLHTVLFNRALGVVKPRDVEVPGLGVVYAHCGDSGVHRKVEEQIGKFCAWAERHPGKVGQVILSFYERRFKQVWFSKQEEKLYWEQWQINLLIQDPRAPSVAGKTAEERKAMLHAAIQEALDTVLRAVNEKKEHIPPVVSSDIVTFPFDISISCADDSSFGLDTIKNFLVQTAPPSMLN